MYIYSKGRFHYTPDRWGVKRWAVKGVKCQNSHKNTKTVSASQLEVILKLL